MTAVCVFACIYCMDFFVF